MGARDTVGDGEGGVGGEVEGLERGGEEGVMRMWSVFARLEEGSSRTRASGSLLVTDNFSHR